MTDQNWMYCPLCGDMHEVKHFYDDIPLLLCEKAEDGAVYGFNVDAQVKSMEDEKKITAKNLEEIGPEVAKELGRYNRQNLKLTTTQDYLKAELLGKRIAKSHDTQGEDCGIYPVQFRGWVITACRWHDHAYSERSWHEENMSRSEVDTAFLNQLLELSNKGDYKFLKRVASYTMYGVTRLLGWAWWEGKR